MRHLGLDVGTKTIGLAVSDEEGRVATPLRTLARKGGAHDVESVRQAFAEVQAGALVLGLPLGLDGREGAASKRVREFGSSLARSLGCDVHYIDERFTTVAAERVLIDADLSRRRRKTVIDHVAATLLLQLFLDRQVALGGAA